MTFDDVLEPATVESQPERLATHDRRCAARPTRYVLFWHGAGAGWPITAGAGDVAQGPVGPSVAVVHVIDTSTD